MLRIGICDDELGARQALGGMLERLLERRDLAHSIYEFSSAEGVLTWLSKHPDELDILFLDIEMHQMNGMEAARQIRKAGSGLILVFVTGYNDYVFDGYSVGALDYITKPADAARLQTVVERALALLHRQEPQTFSLQNTEGMFRVPHSQILYFMSDKRQVILATPQRRYSFYGKLDEVAQNVGAGFVRIHQRYLVNASAVSGVENGCVNIGAEALPISRAMRQSAVAEIGKAILKTEGTA